MRQPLSRRTFLRGAGAAALGLPLLQAMGGSARAQAYVPPKRIVFFFTGNGFPMERWKCDVPAGESTDFTLSPILAPLAPVRDKCLFLEGVPMSSSYDPLQQASAHQGGVASMFTGTWAGPGTQDGGENLLAGYAISESLDHHLAGAIGGETRFPAYYFGVINTIPALITRMFYAGADEPISANHDPWAVHQDLFTDLTTDADVLAARVAEQRTVLGAVMDDYRSLRCRLGAEDRLRLDQHLAQVEEIERRLDLAGMGGAPACSVPDLGGQIATQDFANIPELGRLQMDQLAMALACDLTRVAGLQWVSPVNGVVYTWLGHDEQHHDISHDNSTDAKDKLQQINAWNAEQFLYLVQKLDGIPEGDGTLLDSTILVWASECGDPWTHDRHDVGWTLAGGGLRTGRYVKLSGTDTHAHNRLLLALAHAMDVPLDTFGAADYCVGGPLDDL